MLDKIVLILSAKYNLDPEIVEKVIISEFKFTVDTMQQGEFQSVHLHHLGKFAVKPNRLKQLNEYNKHS